MWTQLHFSAFIIKGSFYNAFLIILWKKKKSKFQISDLHIYTSGKIFCTNYVCIKYILYSAICTCMLLLLINIHSDAFIYIGSTKISVSLLQSIQYTSPQQFFHSFFCWEVFLSSWCGRSSLIYCFQSCKRTTASHVQSGRGLQGNWDPK